MDEYRSANLSLWRELVAVHAESTEYDLAGFIQGKSSLRSVELTELSDLNGQSVLHLMCHFGLDSMSLARAGAHVTGVDYAPEAIALARKLSKQVGVKARFVCSDVYDLPNKLKGKFDMVFISYGVLAWLPDLNKWAAVIARFLKPGGFFYIVELHPTTLLFADNADGSGIVATQAQAANPRLVPVHGSYADRTVKLTQPVKYKWQHTTADILNSLMQAGLRLEFFHEFPFCSFQKFACMEKGSDDWWRFPEGIAPGVPLLFSLRAAKPHSPRRKRVARARRSGSGAT